MQRTQLWSEACGYTGVARNGLRTGGRACVLRRRARETCLGPSAAASGKGASLRGGVRRTGMPARGGGIGRQRRAITGAARVHARVVKRSLRARRRSGRIDSRV